MPPRRRSSAVEQLIRNQQVPGSIPGVGSIRLALVGAGHAHLEILRRQSLTPQPRLAITLVAAGESHHYSGMVPGYLQGTYSEAEIAFPLPPLVARAGGVMVQGAATGIDVAARAIRIDGAEPVRYDLVSFNVGSRAGGVTEGVRRHAASVKPIGRAVELRRRLEALAGTPRAEPARVVVVGGGAAGIEVACAADRVLGGHPRAIALLEAGDRLLVGAEPRLRRRAAAILAAKGITLRHGAAARDVVAGAVELADGSRLASDLTVWLTGAVGDPLFRDSGLRLDGRGFLLVDSSLRALDHPEIFAVGDCATLVDHPQTPKAGVYAVREAPILWRSLLAAADGSAPPSYRPQRGFLALLNTADGKALLSFHGLVAHARWAWRLKDRIDRGFMAKYQRLARPG